MSRLSLFTLALGLAATSVCAAGIYAPTEFYKIRVDIEKKRKWQYVRVTDRLDFTDVSPWSDWKDREERRPDRWYILGTKIKSSVAGGYLAYDPSGQDPRVFLSREAGKGTDWKIGDRKGVIQAMSGEVKGWFLHIEEYEEKEEDGKTTTACSLVLRKGVEQPKVHITRLLTYRATAK